MRNIFLLVSLLALFFSCTPKNGSEWVEILPYQAEAELIESLSQMTDPCRKSENYIPDVDNLKHTSMKFVKVNVHIIQNSEGKGNLAGDWGKKYVRDVLTWATDGLYANDKMRLPLKNTTPVISSRYTYKLWPTTYIPGDDGIYYHRDEELYYNINRGKEKNIFDREVFDKYGIQKDSVLNIFVQDVHLDSLKSSEFDPKANGVAFSTWVKVANWFDAVRDSTYKNGKLKLPRKYIPPKLLNHEIGHVFSLAHAWRSDRCDDTPEHKNCWNSTGRPPCVNISNNIMDYNAHMSALTPCQLGRVHKSMLTNKTKRALLVKDWCDLNEYKNIVVKDSLAWNGCKTIQGNIIIEDGGKLIIRCQTSMPNNSQIIVHPKGELVLQGAYLHNDCEGQWKGIKVLRQGKMKGKVTYIGEATKIEDCQHTIELQKVPEIKS